MDPVALVVLSIAALELPVAVEEPRPILACVLAEGCAVVLVA